jgi:hypothetical protein
MRKMNYCGSILNITEWIQTSNAWEYYITDQKHSDDIVLALVMGFETELGDISLEEIEPFIRMRSKELDKLLPAEGCKWEDD